jgi:hypothetical protein
VLEGARFVLSQHDHLAGTFGEAFEQGMRMVPDSPAPTESRSQPFYGLASALT